MLTLFSVKVHKKAKTSQPHEPDTMGSKLNIRHTLNIMLTLNTDFLFPKVRINTPNRKNLIAEMCNGTPLQYSCLENPMDGGAYRLQSLGSLRVGHNWATSLSLFTFLHLRGKWQPTPVSLPGESQGWGAWWAAVYGVAQSQTWLKRLSSSSSTLSHASSIWRILSTPQISTE